MQTTTILLLTTDSGLHVLYYAIFVLNYQHFCIIQWPPSSLFFLLVFKMELSILSLFIVFDHRHLGHKQQVNKIKQQVIINDSYGHEL